MTHEEQYLGCALIDNEVLVRHPVPERYFLASATAHLHVAMRAMMAAGDRADLVSVTVAHSKAPWWPGAERVAKFVEVPSVALAPSLARAIKNDGRRALFRDWLARTAADIEHDPEEALERAEGELVRLFSEEESAPFVRFYDAARQWCSALIDGGGDSLRVSTGCPALDSNWRLDCGGLHVIAGRPGMGKTSVAFDLAERVAALGTGVLIFSLEMTAANLVGKQVSSWTGVSHEAMTRDFARHLDAIGEAINEHRELPILLNDRGRQTVERISMISQLARRHHNIGLVIVDYVQLVRSAGRHQSREQEVAHISGSLKELAKTINCPVVALSQLNRAVETRENKRPQLADLRESGAIEQDADTVALLYRPEYYAIMAKKPVPEDQVGLIEMNVAKQRTIGPRTLIGKWEPEINRFDWGRLTGIMRSAPMPHEERRYGDDA